MTACRNTTVTIKKGTLIKLTVSKFAVSLQGLKFGNEKYYEELNH
jgi:hypothetical protein